MTPAVKALEKAGVAFRLHQYKAGDSDLGWGEEAAAAMGVDPACVFKTLIAKLQGGAAQGYVVAVVPVSLMLDLPAVARVFGAKKAMMSEPDAATRMTGYVLGGISPFGQKRRLPLALDQSAMAFDAIHVSGGRRGVEIEIAPADLLQATAGVCDEIARQ